MPEFFEKVKKRLKKKLQTACGMCRDAARMKKGRKPKLPAFRILAEGEGFEPSIRNFRMPPFQGGTFNHSATLPRWSELTVSSESAIVQYIFKVV